MNLVYPREALRLGFAVLLSLLVWGALGWVLREGLAVMLAIFGLIHLLARSAFIARLRGDGVRIGPLQMPELNARLLAVCRRLNMDGTPELYLLHEPGAFDMAAARFLGTHYVVLHASVLQALEPLPAAQDFYLGHEISRARHGHQMWRPLLLPAQLLPLIGTAMARAIVYTADRHGLAACENPAYAKIALAAMAAGANWKKVNLRTYEEQLPDTRGFWSSYHELTGDQPWLVKRMNALSALADKREPKFPMINPLAWLAALLTPRLPRSRAGLLCLAIFPLIAAVCGKPVYLDVTRGHAVNAAFEASAPLRAVIEEHSALQLRLPTLEELGQGGSEMRSGNIVARIQPMEAGRIAIVFSGDAELEGRTLLLYPQPFQGSYRAMDWNCSGQLPAKLHPKGCTWVDVEGAAAEPTAPPAPAETAPAAPEAAQPAAAVDPQAAAIAAELQATRGDPAAMTFFNRLMVANATNAADAVKALVQRYHQTSKAWPKSLADIGYAQTRVALDNEGQVIGNLALAAGGQVNVLIEGGVFNGRTLSFKPRIAGNVYTWSCSGGGIPADYLSGGCR